MESPENQSLEAERGPKFRHWDAAPPILLYGNRSRTEAASRYLRKLRLSSSLGKI